MRLIAIATGAIGSAAIQKDANQRQSLDYHQRQRCNYCHRPGDCDVLIIRVEEKRMKSTDGYTGY